MDDMVEVWGYISALIVFVLGLIIVVKISRYFNVKQRHALFLYCWHTIFCIFYLIYTGDNVSDAVVYFERARSGEFGLFPGTPAVLSLNYVFIYIMKFSLLGSFLVNNIYGSIGLIVFKACLNVAVKNKGSLLKALVWIIILLPSISFWSSSLGKESVVFLSVNLALWSAIQLKSRMKLMVLAIILMFIMRPHIAAIMLFALAFAIALDSKVYILKRLLIIFSTMFLSIAMISFLIQYVGLDDSGGSEALTDYVETRQSYNMTEGGGVDIASMSLPMQLFTYMFRPFIFEARSITTLAAALDNLILLYLFIAGGYALLKKKFQNFTENRKFMWVYAILAWIVLATTTANLGIAVRQKWMFAPMLIFLTISLIGKKKKKPVVADNSAVNLPSAGRLK